MPGTPTRPLPSPLGLPLQPVRRAGGVPDRRACVVRGATCGAARAVRTMTPSSAAASPGFVGAPGPGLWSPARGGATVSAAPPPGWATRGGAAPGRVSLFGAIRPPRRVLLRPSSFCGSPVWPASAAPAPGGPCRGARAPPPGRLAPLSPARRHRRPQPRRLGVASVCAKAPSPSSSSSSATGAVEAGSVVEVAAPNGERRLALVLANDGKRNWRIIDTRRRQASVAPKQITWTFPPASSTVPSSRLPTGGAASTEQEALVDALVQYQGRVAKRADAAAGELEIAWEMLIDDAGGGAGAADGEGNAKPPHYSASDLADILFDGSSSPDDVYAAHVLLYRDGGQLFKPLKGIPDAFLPRDQDAIEALRSLRRVEDERKVAVASRAAGIRAAIAKGSFAKLVETVGDDDAAAMAAALEELALTAVIRYEDEDMDSYGTPRLTSLDRLSSDRARVLATEACTAMKRTVVPATAIDALVALKVFGPHESLELRASHFYPPTFSPELQEAANGLLSAGPLASEVGPSACRTDLRHLDSYAVDSASTFEVDDAMSWEADTGRLWVHIADVSAWLKPGEPLTTEALRRSCTLYLPTETITMLPLELARDGLSLDASNGHAHVSEEENAVLALSFGFTVAEDGSLGDPQVMPSLIRRPWRLTYELADALLSHGAEDEETLTMAAEAGFSTEAIATMTAELLAMEEVAARRKRKREASGALFISLPQAVIKVKNPSSERPDIDFTVLHSDTRSWELVSELMVAAGALAGAYCKEHNIPVPFRGQEDFERVGSEELDTIAAGPARESARLRHATTSSSSTEAMEHSALGLAAYVQVTSPIRRASDLLAHWQLKAFVRGGMDALPFSADEMADEVARVATAARSSRSLENRSKKYWLFELLRRAGPRKVWQALTVRFPRNGDGKLVLCFIEELGSHLMVRTSGSIGLGVRVDVVVKVAEPRSGFCRAVATPTVAAEPEPELDLSDVASDVTLDAMDDDGFTSSTDELDALLGQPKAGSDGLPLQAEDAMPTADVSNISLGDV